MGPGPEERNLLGDNTQKWSVKFLTEYLKWDLVVENYDITKAKIKAKNGLDTILQCFDPFYNKKINIIMECKYRSETESINLSKLTDMVYRLKNKIEISQYTAAFSNTLFEEKIHDGEKWVGLLFLKLKAYDHNALMETINSVEISGSKEAPTLLGIIANYRIAKLREFLKGRDSVEFYYPVHGQNKDPIWQRYLSYSYLFSDLIAGRYRTKNGIFSFVISFEEPSEENVKYISTVIKTWYIRKEIKTVYFTEGSNMDIQQLESLKPEDLDFEIAIINGDLSLNINVEDL